MVVNRLGPIANIHAYIKYNIERQFLILNFVSLRSLANLNLCPQANIVSIWFLHKKEELKP